MLMGHTDGLSDHGSTKDHIVDNPESELDDDDVVSSEEILYTASFEELAENNIKYDSIIWFSISLLLVLAWGFGIIMLLYWPIRRFVLQKDISSRKLYVTTDEIVFKVSRPSFIPCLGITTIEKRVPLSLVIDIIIEQGCLQSVYEIHTFRVESIARGKAAPVDELQVQGVANPALLRKVIITEAAKIIEDVGKSRKPAAVIGEVESMSRTGSLTEGPPLVFRSPSKNWKVTSSPHHGSPRHGSPRHASMEHRAVVPGEVLLNKIEEVNKSVKKIELLIEKSQASSESS